MPKSPVRTGAIGPFVAPRYSADAKRTITQKLSEAARPNEPDFGPQDVRLDNIDWLANEYLIFKHAPPLPTLRDLRAKVRQLADATERFLTAVEELPPHLWLSVVMRTPQLRRALVEGAAAGELEEALYRYAWGGYFSDLLGASAPEPVTAADQPRNLLGITPGIAEGTRAYLDELQSRRDKRGPRGNVALRGFNSGLAKIYKDVTGKEPRADYSDSYTEFGGRAGPFVRFVAACLEPIDPEAVNDLLGHTIHRYLDRAREA